MHYFALMADQEREVRLITLTGLALLVGIIAGIGALFFRMLIAGMHNLFFFGELSLTPQPETLMGVSGWGPLVILVPVIGGMGVVWLTRRVSPEIRGWGVPEVMDAIYHREGNIRPVIALAKSLASALSIGSGAAVGREGPIIQIGSSFGSTIGQLTRLVPWQRITLLSSGAGAGIAATFNTPLGGVMFAIELMLPEVSSRTFLPVVVATATATYVGRLFFGIDPVFLLPLSEAVDATPVHLPEIAAYICFGLICGAASTLFIQALNLSETAFERYFHNDYLRHAVGMTMVGVLIYLLGQQFGHYFVHGTSNGTISAVLGEELNALGLIAILFVAKLLATCVSLGSGASGGVFSPCLFLGTTLGAVYGGAIEWVWPQAGMDYGKFAIVGMAGILGGATGGAMTAIVMIFEMTRDYHMIVPMVLVVALAIGVRRLLSKEDIYTIKLSWQGKYIPRERHTNMFLVRHAFEMLEERFLMETEATTLEQVMQALDQSKGIRYVLVMRGERIRGVVPIGDTLRKSAKRIHSQTTLGKLASPAFIIAGRDETLRDVLKRMSREAAYYAVIVPDEEVGMSAQHPVGVIGKHRIAESLMQQFRQ